VAESLTCNIGYSDEEASVPGLDEETCFVAGGTAAKVAGGASGMDVSLGSCTALFADVSGILAVDVEGGGSGWAASVG